MVAKVLISSVGSGVGYGILRSLRMSNQEFYVIGLNSVALSAGVYGCDTSYLVSSISDKKAYQEDLLEIVRHEKPDMIIPGRDAELGVLIEIRDELENNGAFLMIGSEESVKFCTDKYFASQQISSAGLPFTKAARNRREIMALIDQCGFPLVIKPNHGYASRNVKVIWKLEDIENLEETDNNWIVQKYLVPAEWGISRKDIGPDLVYSNGTLRQENEYSVQILFGYDEILGIFSSCNSLTNGAPIAIKVVEDNDLEMKALSIGKFLKEKGLIGPLNLQAKNDIDDGFIFFEVNGRFTGITPIRAKMGFNEVLAIYQYFILGKSPSESLHYEKGQIAYRYYCESIFKAKDLQRLETSKKWTTSQ